MGCLPQSELDGYLRGQLSPERAALAEAHLAGCESCAARLGEAPEEGECEDDAPALPPDPAELGPGSRAGSFELLSKGPGGGFEAADPSGRRVELFVYATKDAEALLRKARALGSRPHPNLRRVEGSGLHGGAAFVALECREGIPLQAWLEEPRPPREVLRAFAGLARGMGALHAAGLVHGRFSAAAARLAGGRAVVWELDLAALGECEPTVEVDPSLARSGLRTGALELQAQGAPEQHLRGVAGPRSDQFALCAALYQALYRRAPFDPRRLAAEAARADEAEDPDLRQNLTERIGPVAVIAAPPRDRRVPSRAREAMMRGLSLSPQERLPSMEALAAKLEVPWWRALG